MSRRRLAELVVLGCAVLAVVVYGAYRVVTARSAGHAGTGEVQTGSTGAEGLILVIVTVFAGLALVTTLALLRVGATRARYRRLRDAALRLVEHESPAGPDPAVVPRVVDLLNSAARDVAHHLGLDPVLVRASVFLPMGDVLCMPTRLAAHFPDPVEAKIAIRPGEGSAGRAFSTGQQNVAIYHQARSDTSIADEAEREKVSLNLKWVISTPIFGTDKKVAGVLNVDGVNAEVPIEDLRRQAGTLVYWAELAGILLGYRPERRGPVQPGEAREAR